ncbi:MAG: heme lyase CcmF/NrfE family subunit [bacterium]
MILVGELSLWVALLMAAWAAVTSFAGGTLGRDDLMASGRRGLYATTFMVILASVALWTALLTHDFSLEYVAWQTSANMPSIYVFAAFWSGQAGSMLFWALILSCYSAVAVWSAREKAPDLAPYASGTLALILLFFIATACFKANPYDRLAFVPADGKGMNPPLQNPGMVVHPPSLYLGYVATAIPFAFAVAALITRQLDTTWLRVVRRWSLISWFFLTVGITLGMWWAYVERGWGGYWAWDPVENASLLPWLTSTAFLHSILLQEKRGMLRKWNVALVVTTFLLAIFGTFITRNGVIGTVHSLARSPVGAWSATFFFAVTGVAIYLVATRLRDLEDSAVPESMVSREAALLYNNLVLVGIAFSVLWGTLFPILGEWARGSKVTVGAPFFNSMIVPLGLLLLALMGIGPLLAWRKASTSKLKRQFIVPASAGVVAGVVLVALGMRNFHALIACTLAGFVAGTIAQEFYTGIGARRTIHGESLPLAAVRLVARNRRRYGGYIVHAGIVILFSAFAGLAFSRDYDVSLRAGESKELVDPLGHRWRFVSQGISTAEMLNRFATTIGLEVFRDDVRQGIIASEKRQYFDSNKQTQFEPSTEVGIRTSAMLDLYVVLADVRNDTAELRISFNPLVVWVWIGGMVMAIGGLIVMWPQAERRGAPSSHVVTLAPSHELVSAP